jgi:hypothetical protein
VTQEYEYNPNEESHMSKATSKKDPYILHARGSRVIRHALLRLSVIGLLLALPLTPAHAVPSFARQTGYTCAVCHTVFPELTAFGRDFKLHGYTQIKSQEEQSKQLQENPFAPLSAMIQVSFTQTAQKQPDTQNGNVLLPQELSLFYAGRISSHMGTFIQLTYEGGDVDHFGMDNTDIRYANETKNKNVVYGATLNNNPTVQDLWNSTPVWSFPFSGSSTAVEPLASTQLEGPLEQQVAGLGGFGLLNNKFYGEITLYRNSQIGQPAPADGANTDVTDGTAPYLRFAYQHQWGSNYISAGAYGIVVDKFPSGISGPTNNYTDAAVDLQYQYIKEKRILTLQSTYIHEKQQLDASFASGASANQSDTLETFKAAATYYHNRKLGGTLSYFNTWGSEDSGLYQPDPVDGSRTGKPNTNGFILEFDYLPWLNTKFSVQYTLYNEFNGASSNYDGSGRDASDNNTLYVLAWLMF